MTEPKMIVPNTTQGATSVPVGADVAIESQRQEASVSDRPQRMVLYVEDNLVNLELVSQILEHRPDLRLLIATDGNRGIEFARLHLPAVILMDLNLPGISGMEATRILLGDPVTAFIPIIAFSANAIPGGFRKGQTGGFYDYIAKPIRIKVFLETLDAALEFAGSHSAPAAK